MIVGNVYKINFDGQNNQNNFLSRFTDILQNVLIIFLFYHVISSRFVLMSSILYTYLMHYIIFYNIHFRFRFRSFKGWGVICGDGFGVLEAMVVCRSAGLGYAAGAFQTDQFGGMDQPVVLSAVECAGNESSIAHCYYHHKATCSSRKETVAAVVCTRGE